MTPKIASALIVLSIMLIAFIPTAGAEEESPPTVCAYYFYGTGCSACEAVEPHIDALDEKYDFLELEKFEIWYNKANNKLLAQFYEKYGVEDGGTPTVIIGDDVLIGYNTIQNGLEPLILEHQEAGLACPVSGEKLPTVGLVALLSAAAIDAINPCALAVLILLLSTVLLARRRRVALCAGLAFTAAVFISYFLMGVGLFSVLSKLTGVSYWVKKGLGVLAIAIGLFNLKDYFRPGALGFRTEVPTGWRPKMKALIGGVTSVPGAFVVGLIVSLFLLPCTSGPYIVITGMLADYATFWGAVPLLLLYNFVFILPMLVLTWLVYYGMKPHTVEKWRVQRIKYLHLLAGIVLIGLGILLLVGIL